MIGSGKYDLPGIRKGGAALLRAGLAKLSFGASLLAGPFKNTTDLFLEFIAEVLANNGIVVLNLLAIARDKKIDPAKLVDALEKGLAQAERPDLTPAEKEKIDAEVINAFRRAVRYSR